MKWKREQKGKKSLFTVLREHDSIGHKRLNALITTSLTHLFKKKDNNLYGSTAHLTHLFKNFS